MAEDIHILHNIPKPDIDRTSSGRSFGDGTYEYFSKFSRPKGSSLNTLLLGVMIFQASFFVIFTILVMYDQSMVSVVLVGLILMWSFTHPTILLRRFRRNLQVTVKDTEISKLLRTSGSLEDEIRMDKAVAAFRWVRQTFD